MEEQEEEEGRTVLTSIKTWQDTETELTGSQTTTQTASQPWPDLLADGQQRKGEKDEWSGLLLHDPPFPFVPPFDFAKEPGIAEKTSKFLYF